MIQDGSYEVDESILFYANLMPFRYVEFQRSEILASSGIEERQFGEDQFYKPNLLPKSESFKKSAELLVNMYS